MVTYRIERRAGYSVAMFFLAASAFSTTTNSRTLQESLLRAYQFNPTLTGARSGQRANDENVPIQKAVGRPQLITGADYTELLACPTCLPRRNVQADATLSVPLYSGGAVRNGISAAKIRVEAGRANLRGTELAIFSQVVAAYMDVIANRAIVSLNRSNVGVLEVNVQASNRRFEVGDLTRTDIAQSDSRLAIARSDLQQAEADLAASRENYIALVGEAPGALDQPPALPGLPENADIAVQIALNDNPDIFAAKKEREAAAYDVRIAKAAILPTLSGFAQGSYTNYLGSLNRTTSEPVDQAERQAAIGISISMPLYQGGGPGAQVRQSQARESQFIEREIEIERGVIAQTRAAHASWQAALRTIRSSQTAVDASTLSLRGVRAENAVGSRTILDILNAEQEALNARVRLVSARRNAYVAAFSLLAAMGHAEADDLGLDGGVLYDPLVNYDRVRNKLLDWDFDPAPRTVATRTIDTRAQHPSDIEFIQPLVD